MYMIRATTPWGGSFFRRPGFIRMHLVIWRNGGPHERFFLALGVFTYLFLPVASLAIVWALWNSRAFLYETFLSFGLAATTYGAFHGAFSVAMINARIWRLYVGEGRLQPHDEYFLEFARFLENEGDGGLFPGAARWALGLWAVYYGIITFSVVFALLFAPRLGLATPLVVAALDAVVVFSCWIAWQFHVHSVSKEMDTRGYRLSTYAKAAGWMP